MTVQIPRAAARFIFRLAFLVLGIGLVVSAALFLLASRLSAASYATTIGTVTESGVSESTCTTSSRGGRGRPYTCFRPSISYRYSVGGRNYWGEGLYDDTNFYYDEAEDAEAALAPFRSSGTVTVYYLPSDPRRSALAHGGWNFLIWIMGGIGIGLVLLSRMFKP